MLSGSGSYNYICGTDDYLLVDIAYYNEILTVLALQNKKLSGLDYPNLNKWMNDINNITEVSICDEELTKVINKYQLN